MDTVQGSTVGWQQLSPENLRKHPPPSITMFPMLITQASCLIRPHIIWLAGFVDADTMCRAAARPDLALHRDETRLVFFSANNVFRYNADTHFFPAVCELGPDERGLRIEY